MLLHLLFQRPSLVCMAPSMRNIFFIPQVMCGAMAVIPYAKRTRHPMMPLMELRSAGQVARQVEMMPTML
jgi:hypothetical protein